MEGLWFFVSFRIFFSDNTRVRIFIFFVARSANFFPEFNIRLYDKNSESDYFFFPPPKSEYFFQQHWESEYFFLEKNHNSLPPFKLNGHSLMTLPIKTITSVLKVSTDIITNNCPIGLAAILAIMSVSTFKTAVILYLSVSVLSSTL